MEILATAVRRGLKICATGYSGPALMRRASQDISRNVAHGTTVRQNELFEDAPASIKYREHTDELRFEDLPKIVRDATEKSISLLVV